MSNEKYKQSPACDGDCSHCQEANDCSQASFTVNLNEFSKIKKIIGVVSGKGGVGKSFVSSLLAVSLAKKGLKVGLLDADITGPSIPKTFGVKERAYGQNNLIYPFISPELKIKMISSNMLLEHDDEPIIWRGSLISTIVKQFYSDVLWGELDVLVIDMPPGTGDVALTIFQSIPVDEIIMVTTPQDLVSLIVKKAVNMAKMMHIKIRGIIENMAYIECPKCHEKISLYGESSTAELLKDEDINLIASLPLDPALTKLINHGEIEKYEGKYLDEVAEKIYQELKDEETE